MSAMWLPPVCAPRGTPGRKENHAARRRSSLAGRAGRQSKALLRSGHFRAVDTAIENPMEKPITNTSSTTSKKRPLYRRFGRGAQVARFGTPSTPICRRRGSHGIQSAVFAGRQPAELPGDRAYGDAARRVFFHREAWISQLLAPRFRMLKPNITFTALYDDSLNVRTFASRRERLGPAFREVLEIAHRTVSIRLPQGERQ